MKVGDLVQLLGGGKGVIRGITIFASPDGFAVSGEMISSNIALLLGIEIHNGLNHAKILCDDIVGYVPDHFLEVVG